MQYRFATIDILDKAFHAARKRKQTTSPLHALVPQMAGAGRVHSDDRVRGKSRDQRRRDRRREQRKNAEVAGIPKHRAVTLKTSADGKRIVKSLSAKKIKKKEQQLRLLSKSGAISAAAMDI